MAIGDQDDCLARLKMLLPIGWFKDETPILDGLLSGLAWALSFGYGLIAYVRLQTRIATATDIFLDLISLDFFGTWLPRRQGEQDSLFRKRILINLLRERATRKGMVLALQILTGRTPTIFEPTRPVDTGAYATNTMGYGVVGAYGSLLLPYQAFVTAFRPTGSGIPNIAGYGVPTGAYSTASRAEYGSMDMIIGAVTDADIYAAVDAVKPAGTTIWTRISS